MRIKYTVIKTGILFFFMQTLSGQNEAHYVQWLNQNYFAGLTEVAVQAGRADIVNDEYAIEVEWAYKWKNSIGQALWYGLQTNKKSGIVLLMNDINDRKYGIMLQSALDYAGISEKIKVWFYPEDFGGSFEVVQNERMEFKQNLIDTNGNYTRNKNSGVRHNSKCSYFNCTNCLPCGPGDGKKACGKCGG